MLQAHARACVQQAELEPLGPQAAVRPGLVQRAVALGALERRGQATPAERGVPMGPGKAGPSRLLLLERHCETLPAVGARLHAGPRAESPCGAGCVCVECARQG